MREWQSTGKLQRDDTQMDKDPNEGQMCLVLLGGHASQRRPLERRMFFAAALQEMRGKELQLATDPTALVYWNVWYTLWTTLFDDSSSRNYLGS